MIADSQYRSADVFRVIRGFGAEPVIPYLLKVREPMINLYVTKRFKIKGDPRLVDLYKLKMAVGTSLQGWKAGAHDGKPTVEGSR